MQNFTKQQRISPNIVTHDCSRVHIHSSNIRLRMVCCFTCNNWVLVWENVCSWVKYAVIFRKNLHILVLPLVLQFWFPFHYTVTVLHVTIVSGLTAQGQQGWPKAGIIRSLKVLSPFKGTAALQSPVSVSARPLHVTAPPHQKRNTF